MKILVAGGCGYIGSVLVPMLIEQGHAVTVIDCCYFGRNLPDGVDVVVGDTRAITETHLYRVDRVIDLAGLSNDPSCDLRSEVTIENNFRGAVHLAATAYRSGVSYYTYVSSCSVYGDTGEQVHVNPLTEYARAKYAVERAIKRFWGDPRLSIPRLATVYGLSPRMRFDLAPNLMTLHAVRRGVVEVYGEGTQWRPFVHVRDVARFLCNPRPDSVDVGSNDMTMTAKALAERVAAVTGAQCIHRLDMPTDTRSYKPDFWRPSGTVKLEDGIREIADALRAGTVTDGPMTRTVERYRALITEGQL